MYSEEYQTLDRLEARQKVHLRYSEPPDNIEETTLAAAMVAPDDAILDIGCGTGSFLNLLASRDIGRILIGLDISAAAIAAVASRGIRAVRADVRQTPFRDGVFDSVFARHVFDHVEDIVGGVRECRRVIREGGNLVVVMNHEGQASSLRNLITETVVSWGVHIPEHDEITAGTLQRIMSAEFGNALVHNFRGELVFPNPSALSEFAESLLSFYGLPPGSPLRAVISRQLATKIEESFQLSGTVWRDPKGYSVIRSVK